MEEAPENGMESSYSAHANGMNEREKCENFLNTCSSNDINHNITLEITGQYQLKESEQFSSKF
jgi:hypothetical protein